MLFLKISHDEGKASALFFSRYDRLAPSSTTPPPGHSAPCSRNRPSVVKKSDHYYGVLCIGITESMYICSHCSSSHPMRRKGDMSSRLRGERAHYSADLAEL